MHLCSATKLLVKHELKVFGTMPSLWMSLNSFMPWTNKGTANMQSKYTCTVWSCSLSSMCLQSGICQTIHT